MGTLTRYQSPSARLLTHILERPELMAAVRELPAPVLATLIDRVGLEDAGEIVALASTAQLERVLDQDVWRADTPGADERFEPERFVLWLSVMLEAGEDSVAERLCELPPDTLFLAVHRLVLVTDAAALSVREEFGIAEDTAFEAWEEFRLLARDRDAWDVVWTCLLALDRDHHDLLRALLDRCWAIDAERDLEPDDSGGSVLDGDAMLENDVASGREDRRSSAGFVSAADARAFLELSRRGWDTHERDPITRAYFRALPEVHGDGGGDGDAGVHAQMDEERARRPDMAALVGLLRDAEVVVQPSNVRALPASDSHTATPPVSLPTLLDAAMAKLGVTHPQVFAERVEELGYLANVLLAAGAHEGRALRPVEALECAVAACSLGLEDAIADLRGASTVTAHDHLLHASADRLFRAGYHTLHAELIAPAQAWLEAQCHAHGHAVDHGAAFRIRDEIDAAQIGLDDAAFSALLALIETGPWFAGSLVRVGRPFVASREDVRVAHEFCASLRSITGGV